MVELVIKKASEAKVESAMVRCCKEMQKIQMQLERGARVEELVANIYPMVNDQMEKTIADGGESTEVVLFERDLEEFNYESPVEIVEAMEIIGKCLEDSGYRVYCHEYSQSWKTRSGKFGYLRVSWWD